MPFFFVGPALLVSLSSPPGLGPSRVRGFFGLPRLFLFLFLFFSQPFGFFSQVGRPPLPGAPGVFGPGRFYSMMRFSGAGQGVAAPFALNGARAARWARGRFCPAPLRPAAAPRFLRFRLFAFFAFFFYFCVWLFCLGALAPACSLFALVFVLLFLIAFFFFFFFVFFFFFFFLFFIRLPLARAGFAGRAFVSRRAPAWPLGVGRGVFSLGRRRRLGFGAGRVRSCASITLSGFSTPG